MYRQSAIFQELFSMSVLIDIEKYQYGISLVKIPVVLKAKLTYWYAKMGFLAILPI